MALLVLLFASLLASARALDSEQLKSCFERYDGFKMIDTVPFHSEWRMKSEEHCLEFCIRASSRCASIVYDKLDHICHYFFTKGIEEEKLVKQPKMVYLQVAEKKCVDDMLSAIELEEEAARSAAAAPPSEFSNDESPGAAEANTGSEANNEAEGAPDVVDQAEETVVSSVSDPTSVSTNASTLEDREEPANANTEWSSPRRRAKHREDAIFDVANTLPSRYAGTGVDEVILDREHQLSERSRESDDKPPTRNAADLVPLPGADGVKANDAEPDAPENKKSVYHPKTKPRKASPSPAESQSSPAVVTDAPVHEEQFPDAQQESATDLQSATTQAARKPEMMPIMSAFKAIKRVTYPSKQWDENEKAYTPPTHGASAVNMRDELRELAMELESATTATASEDNAAHERSEIRRHPTMASLLRSSSPVPATESRTLPTATTLEDEECQAGTNQIWLAVENSGFNISNQDPAHYRPVTKAADKPGDCASACTGLQIGDDLCNAFTFVETDKACIFHSIRDDFPVIASLRNDFSTRAFRRFCYSDTLTPFSGCGDFLAFRDYALQLAPREIFHGLPEGMEGLSGCIELCVLSSEFRCHSASFDIGMGDCAIFDQHSLSAPESFKTHTRPNMIYFENGCVGSDVHESAAAQATVQRVRPSLTPVKIEFKHAV